LSDLLHTIEFTWSVPNDDNRIEDGRELREEFLEVNNITLKKRTLDEFISDPVTTFEVMVALTKRLEYISSSTPDKREKFYIDMINNLGLGSYTDNFSTEKFPETAEELIRETVQDMIDRKYDRNGNGSLFPIKRIPPKDMRKTEIWYQMMYYYQENYNF
jgi:hypothetical protein